MPDAQHAAQVIWCSTRRLRALPGQERVLAAVRLELARLALADETKRLPWRAYSPQDGEPESYQACEAAVNDASKLLAASAASAETDLPPSRIVALIWAASDPKAGPDTGASGPFPWTRNSAAKIAAAIGPVAMAGVADRYAYCFLYDREGLPAQALADGIVGAPAIVPAEADDLWRFMAGPPPEAPPVTVPRWRRVAGTGMVFAALALFVLSSISIYYTVRLGQYAARLTQPTADASYCMPPVLAPDTVAAWQQDWLATGKCGRPWAEARREVSVPLALFDGAPVPLSKADAASPVRSWLPRISLLLQLFGIATAAALLFTGAGMVALGRWDGIAIDERNRVSLSRLQVALWSTVLLPGLAVLGLWNSFIGRPEGPDDSLLGPGPFPQMNAELWAVLGIALATPFASTLILRQKQSNQDAPTNPAPPSPGVSPDKVVADTVLDRRTDPSAAGLADLILGEDASNRNRVDINRVQNLAITIMLVFTYAQMLIDAVSANIPFTNVVAWTTGNPISYFFPRMPVVGSTFLGLLFVSHALYLGAKYSGSTLGASTTAQS